MSDVIRNDQYARRINVFAGLKWGSISPTDIDGFLDFGDRLFVFIETKQGDSLPETGQRLALQRLCDACENAGKWSVVLIASHKGNGDIEVKKLPVVYYRYQKQWIKPRETLTVRQAINKFRELSGMQSTMPSTAHDDDVTEWLREYDEFLG